MKKIIVTFLMASFVTAATAQKNPLGLLSYKKFESLYNYGISSDGKYIFYCYGGAGESGVLIKIDISNTTGTWKTAINNVGNATFTKDSKKIIFSSSLDNLYILDLENHHIDSTPNVVSFKLSDNDQWIAYKNKANELIVKNLKTGNYKVYPGVEDYSFAENGAKIAFDSETDPGKGILSKLSLLNLKTGNSAGIWAGDAAVSNITFDHSGNQLIFFVSNPSIPQNSQAMYFMEGMRQSKLLIDSVNTIMGQQFKFYSGDLKFTNNDQQLLFNMQLVNVKADLFRDTVITKKVNVWSYRDKNVQSQQINQLDEEANRLYKFLLNIENKHITQLTQHNETLIAQLNSNQFLLEKITGDEFEMYWNPLAKDSLFVFNREDGAKTLMNSNLTSQRVPNVVSPDGKYIVTYDVKRRNYLSYEVSTGKVINITKDIKVPLYPEDYDQPGDPNVYGQTIWSKDGTSILIYDNYDIWKVDPKGQQVPENITKSNGRKNGIVFRLVAINNALTFDKTPPDLNQDVYLSAFDKTTKAITFFLRNKKGVLQKLSKGSYVYYPFNNESGDEYLFPPVKSKFANNYLLVRCNVTEAPNLFITKDFKKFKQISGLEPQKQYNWMTSELHHWKLNGDTLAEGILYKPENFDHRKKYPMILSFYEKHSDELNDFKSPAIDSEPFNIPYYVSNGYLVFVPNIYYKVGNPGESSANSIITAAKYLSGFSWVDSTKLGLVGISFGAYEINYLITHSNLFAAASESAGVSDAISHYGSLRRGLHIGWAGNATQFSYENYQSRIGFSLWERPDLFIKNSPIFNMDKITTPLLMQHNPEDGNVSFEQGVELFLGMRRLNKKVWMLEYDGEDHGISTFENQLDFTIRLKQFFDHYLKGTPPPKWMTVGIPAVLKGKDSGLAIDTSGRQP